MRFLKETGGSDQDERKVSETLRRYQSYFTENTEKTDGGAFHEKLVEKTGKNLIYGHKSLIQAIYCIFLETFT